MKRKITFIINPSEVAAGTRGASLGPGAIMAVARAKSSELFSTYPKVQIKDRNDVLDKPIVHPFAKRIESLVKVYKNVSNTVQQVLESGRFPIILAGDHGSAGGTIAGIKAIYPTERIGVIWIDAHGDLHTPFTTPSGNMHGMPLATALNDDNKQEQRNDVPEETVHYWNKLKRIGFDGAKILPEDLVFIGVRDVEKEEISIMNRLNITNFKVDELRKNGAKSVLNQALEQLKECDKIYVSFDVDSMDPEETSHGTGTPVPNGLLVEEARVLLTELAKLPKLACLEIVEVNPCLDEKTNRMAEVTFELLEDVIDVLKK